MANNSGLARILAVSEGGTGASTAAAAKTNLDISGLSVVQSGSFLTELDSSDNTDNRSYILPDVDGTVVAAFIKTDTGDPAAPTNNQPQICINTFDNNVRIYADGAWRTIASGW